MSEVKHISGYKQYVDAVRSEAPKADNKGQVSKNVNFFKKDAFVEKKPERSYQPEQSRAQTDKYTETLVTWMVRDYLSN